MLSLLLLLGAIPMFSYRFARQRYPDRRFLIGGLTLGAVISPLSLGLYSLFFIPYIGLLPGMIGLALTLLHSAPGYNLALMTGIIPRGAVVEGIGHVYLAAIDAVVWAPVYGTVGWVLDLLLLKRSRANASLV
jgi:hypothetical protein